MKELGRGDKDAVHTLRYWSHYADKHQGVCLKFRTDVPGDTLFADARRICYRPTLPVLNSLEDSTEDQIKALLLTKGSAWRYEGEWRLINTKRRGHDSFTPDCLVGVIFGWKMPAKSRRTILDWIDLRDQKIPAYKCEPSDRNGFRLQVSRIWVVSSNGTRTNV